MTAGEKVAREAEKYVGVHENPVGSNRGKPYPEAWQAHWNMGTGWPWCAAFAEAMFRNAGVSDDGIGHPSTAVMYARAKDKGAIVKRPYPGAYLLWPGTHVGIIIRDLGGGVCLTVEGNSGDAVRYKRRAYAGAVIVAPVAVRQHRQARPARRYYLEDRSARPRLVGPWRTKAQREKALRNVKGFIRRVRVGKRFGAYVGPRRVYGPWGTVRERDKARGVLEGRIGRRLRPYSQPVKQVKVSAEEMGKVD